MDATTILDIAEKRFSSRGEDLLTNWNERRIQLQLTDALIEGKFKAFMEYPYPDSKDACDVVITKQENCEQPMDWIELKPILPGWFYWKPGKLIEGGTFKHDIQKLADLRDGNRWFLLVMGTDDGTLEYGIVENPRSRKRLSNNQVVSVISFWTRCGPVGVRTIAVGQQFCHLVLWNVRECCTQEIESEDGVYLLNR